MRFHQNLRVIEGVLHTLGLFGSSISMRQMICAVELAHEDVSLLTNVSKGLYTSVANEFGDTNSAAVERNLRALRAMGKRGYEPSAGNGDVSSESKAVDWGIH